jgi:hypothetical protein
LESSLLSTTINQNEACWDESVLTIINIKIITIKENIQSVA